jgi:hypothetical protein
LYTNTATAGNISHFQQHAHPGHTQEPFTSNCFHCPFPCPILMIPWKNLSLLPGPSSCQRNRLGTALEPASQIEDITACIDTLHGSIPLTLSPYAVSDHLNNTVLPPGNVKFYRILHCPAIPHYGHQKSIPNQATSSIFLARSISRRKGRLLLPAANPSSRCCCRGAAGQPQQRLP